MMDPVPGLAQPEARARGPHRLARRRVDCPGATSRRAAVLPSRIPAPVAGPRCDGGEGRVTLGSRPPRSPRERARCSSVARYDSRRRSTSRIPTAFSRGPSFAPGHLRRASRRQHSRPPGLERAGRYRRGGRRPTVDNRSCKCGHRCLVARRNVASSSDPSSRLGRQANTSGPERRAGIADTEAYWRGPRGQGPSAGDGEGSPAKAGSGAQGPQDGQQCSGR